MFFLNELRTLSGNLEEKLKIAYLKYLERKKFANPKRKAIYENVLFTPKQAEDVERFFVSNYGSKIPLIWHKHFSAFTGNFDKTYFPELLFIPEFERYMNFSDGYVTTFEDKNILPYMAMAAGVKMPQTILSKTAGLVKNTNNEILDENALMNEVRNIGMAFLKPTIDSCSGNGCRVVDVVDGVDTISNESAR